MSEEKDISIKEMFLRFTALSGLTAAGIIQSIITFIKKCDLNIEKFRRMVFDDMLKNTPNLCFFQVKGMMVQTLLLIN